MKNELNIDRAVMIFAGCVILAGLSLALLVNPWWLLLPALAGINLVQSAFTGFCPPALLFRKLGLKPGPAFD